MTQPITLKSDKSHSYYATGEREPNLETLIAICQVLAATPNDLLLPEGKPPSVSDRDRLLARVTAATDNLTLDDLDLAASQLECLSAHRGAPSPRPAARKSAA